MDNLIVTWCNVAKRFPSMKDWNSISTYICKFILWKFCNEIGKESGNYGYIIVMNEFHCNSNIEVILGNTIKS